MTKLTTEYVKKLFDYKDGALFWKKSPSNNTPAGARAGSSKGKKKYYETISIKNKHYSTHRLIWLWHGMPNAKTLDHINGNRYDNRIENLRSVTASQNQHNRGVQKNNSTGVKGVTFENGRYCSSIQVNCKRKRLGGFATLSEAAEARKAAEKSLVSFGEKQ